VAAVPPSAQDTLPDTSAWAAPAEIASGQELIYSGRFEAAQLFFFRLSGRHPRDPVGPALEASALIWWATARQDDGFAEDSVDALLSDAAVRAERAVAAAPGDSARVAGLFWLGTATGYRARQAELHGHYWRAARDARKMRAALSRALALDSSCIDCRLGLAIYDYALARAGVLARLVAHILGLSGGDATQALEWLRRVSDGGIMTRFEAQWLYANALIRESGSDGARREEARRIVSDLAARFPENPVFSRFLDSTTHTP
jgi:hypothetical protein